MVEQRDRPGVTLPEIARTYGRTQRSVRAWTNDPQFPASTGRRGRYLEYDPEAVGRFVVLRFGEPREGGASQATGRLLTRQEAADRARIADSTLRAYIARGQWAQPDEIDAEGNKFWRDTTVDAYMAGRARGKRGAARPKRSEG